MNNKTIIEFGLRRIPELFRPRSMLSPQPSADNIDLGLNNSGYPAQPHPIIVKYQYKTASLLFVGLSNSPKRHKVIRME